MQIIEFLNEYSGAFTLIVTAVYVVATIFICRANIKSAIATREQIAESKRQFEESNRPIIEVEFLLERRLFYVVRFSNHGKRTAQHVKINLNQDFIDSLPRAAYKDRLQAQRGKECIIGIDQHYDLFVGGSELRKTPNLKPMTGTISYECDGRTYTSELYIDIENYMTFFSTDTFEDNLIEAIKNNTSAIKEVNQTIQLSKGESEDA